MLKLAVLASGSGSNLSALIDAEKNGIITDGTISLVVSNKKDAYALVRAKNAGIPALYIKRSEFSSDEEYDSHIVSRLKEYEIDVVLLAGYLRIITSPLLTEYENRILNIHPGLLPEFGGIGMYGLKVHESVINAGVSTSGCTIHLVTKDVDMGPVLAQKHVPVIDGDTPDDLAHRVLKEEHVLYPKTVQEFVSKIKK